MKQEGASKCLRESPECVKIKIKSNMYFQIFTFLRLLFKRRTAVLLLFHLLPFLSVFDLLSKLLFCVLCLPEKCSSLFSGPPGSHLIHSVDFYTDSV